MRVDKSSKTFGLLGRDVLTQVNEIHASLEKLQGGSLNMVLIGRNCVVKLMLIDCFVGLKKELSAEDGT